MASDGVGANSDNDPDFTDEFCEFLQRSVASVDTVEILLLLSKDREKWWETNELRERLATAANLSEGDVAKCLDDLQQSAVISRGGDRRARFRPAPAHDAHVATMARLYVERPVTLFRVIYALRDSKIKTFADAFRLGR